MNEKHKYEVLKDNLKNDISNGNIGYMVNIV